MQPKLKDNISFPPIKVKSYSEFFAALGKALFHGFKALSHGYKGQFDEVLLDLMDVGATLGLEETNSRLAWSLANRSVMRAITELIENNQNSIPLSDEASFVEKIKNLNSERNIRFDSDFFNRPKECLFVKDIQEVLHEWLALVGVEYHKAKAIVNRFPTLFVYALHSVWLDNPEKYRRLLAESPVADSVATEEEWEKYKAYLEKETQEGVFGEFFSLSQIFVPLCAYYKMHHEDKSDSSKLVPDKNKNTKKHVVDLDSCIHEWLDTDTRGDDIRIISGGPGSGKSSFAKMFAASISKTHNVLFIPLYLLDLRRDVEEVVGKFLVSNRFFSENPIGKSGQILIIFDGLDEISQQGKASLDAARDFVSQIQQLLRNYNHNQLNIRVIITGRDLPVQAIETNFRREGQILHVLPYYVPEAKSRLRFQMGFENETYIDENELLKTDKRELWWRKYGEVTGKGYEGLPHELQGEALEEITTQPLLNYLLALSYDRGKIKFSDETNLNELYDDLIDAVYERSWQAPHRPHRSVEGIDKNDFEKILEEIAISTWQGTGRTATIKVIEERCRKNNLGHVLDKFQDLAKDGVTNLLTAFYFQDAGIPGADPSFEFTHKSFGEFLAAKRIVRQLLTTKQALEQQEKYQAGWSYEDALEKWIYLCSNVAIDEYIFSFLCDEVRRRDQNDVKNWQEMLRKLISYMLINGMPFEKIPSLSFLQQTRQSKNSEEALLAALSACSRHTKEISKIEWQENTSAGEWFSKLCGPPTESNVFSRSIINHLDLSKCMLYAKDLYGGNLSNANLGEANLSRANLSRADLSRADLSGANLDGANLEGANLDGAILTKTILRGANLSNANLGGVNLGGAILTDANLRGTNLIEADLTLAYLMKTNLSRANLMKATLIGAVLSDVNLRRADLRESIINGGNLTNADLRNANLGNEDRHRHTMKKVSLIGINLKEADLRGADLRGAVLTGADLRGADLRGADLRGADLKDANFSSANPGQPSANLMGADLRNAILIGAKLVGADLRGAKLHEAQLMGADLSGADLRNAILYKVRLTKADLSEGDLMGANLVQVVLNNQDEQKKTCFSKADLRGADLRGADLTGADLTGADLSGANLTGADLRGANLTGANTEGTIFPEGY